MAETPTGYLPDYRLDGSLLTLRKHHKTLIEEAISGRENRLVLGLPRRAWGYKTKSLDQDERKVIEDFLNARQGQYGAFYFFDQAPQTLAAYNAGTTSGSVETFTLPLKGPWYLGETPAAATYTAVTVGGVAVTVTATPNIGTGGEDRISWTGAQSGAVLITASMVRLRIVARSATDDVDVGFIPGLAELRSQFPILITELITS